MYMRQLIYVIIHFSAMKIEINSTVGHYYVTVAGFFSWYDFDINLV